MKTKPKHKRILLDQWHVDVFIAPKDKLTKKQKQILKSLMDDFIRRQINEITSRMNGGVEIVISQ